MKLKSLVLTLALLAAQFVGAQTVFNPTTTLTALKSNNTSAADTFPGWSNGDAKPGHVSNVPLNVPQTTIVHMVTWWGSPSHPDIGYNSSDAAHIARLVADLRNRNIQGASWLWNGVGGNMDKAALAMKPQFDAAGLKYAIMLSATIPTLKNATTVSGRTAALITITDYLRTKFFSQPGELRKNGRPILLFFGMSQSDYNWTAVRAHVHTFGADEPLFYFRFEKGYSGRAVADGYFGWTDNTQSWITAASALGKDLIFGLNGGFDNSLAPWAASPKVISQAKGQRFQDGLAVAAVNPQITINQIATEDDYQEGSEIETGFATGAIVASTIKPNQLSWTSAVGAFDHYNVYISNDGEKLMPLAQGLSLTTSTLDLSGLQMTNGTWYFVVEAVGKPMVQNVVSAPVPATLGWN